MGELFKFLRGDGESCFYCGRPVDRMTAGGLPCYPEFTYTHMPINKELHRVCRRCRKQEILLMLERKNDLADKTPESYRNFLNHIKEDIQKWHSENKKESESQVDPSLEELDQLEMILDSQTK
jgi:hypothetical protein